VSRVLSEHHINILGSSTGAGADRLALLGRHRLRAASRAVDADAFLLLLARRRLLVVLRRLPVLLRLAFLAFPRRVGLLRTDGKARRHGER